MANGKIPTSLPETLKYVDVINVSTLDSGTPHADGVKYIRTGPFVELFINVKFDSAPSNVKIFTLPSGYRPLYDVVFGGIGGESYGSKSSGIIRTTSGEVVVNSSDDRYVTAHVLFFRK